MNRQSKTLFFLVIVVLLVLSSLAAGNIVLVRAAETAAGQQSATTGKIVRGRVQTSAGTAVAGALISGHRVEQDEHVETQSDAAGYYELNLSPGLWTVTAEPNSGPALSEWINAHEPEKVEFQRDDELESYEVNFTLLAADASVIGSVEMPDGSVPPFSVTVGLHNGEGLGARANIDPASGEFKLALPHGRYDVIVHPHHSGYAGPHLEPAHLPPGETVNLGTITLQSLNARITGLVTDNDGRAVAGMPVTAWQRGRPRLLSTRTISNGHYSLGVISGTWHIQPAPRPDMPYFYIGAGETVRAAAGEVVRDVDFEVLKADATIAGFLVTEDGQRIHDVSGWAQAVNLGSPDIHGGGPIRQGEFQIHVTRGEYLVSVELPPGSAYLASGEVRTAVKSGETVTISVPVQKKDAAISGELVDPRQNHHPVTGVHGTVSAWSDDRWVTTPIRPNSGKYRLEVAAGIWRLNYAIDDEEYVKLGSEQNIPVESGQVVKVDLPVTRKDAAIAGQVRTPNGRPLPGATVIAQGLSGDIQGLRLRVRSDEEGNFHLRLPHGRYRVGASNGQPGWINPVEINVGVEPGTVMENINLRFLEPNATISGRLTVLNTDAEGQALVWAWSERGGFTKGRFRVEQTDPGGQASGGYRLGVISGTTWHMGAIFETDNEIWLGRGSVDLKSNAAILDLKLYGPYPKPPPVVITFDAGQAQRLTLADGTKLFIPAGAMPAEGLVTLRIVPIATLPHQRHAHIVRYGYAIFAADESGRPIEEHFNHNVVIRFRYDEDDLRGGERHLKPAYFSTTTNEWTFPEHFVLNPDRNLVTMAIDHFTNFALVEGQVSEELFLPLLMGAHVQGSPAAKPVTAKE